MELLPPVMSLVFYRLVIVLAAVILAWLGYLLLSSGTTLREGEVEFTLGRVRAKALRAALGAVFSLFAMGFLMAALFTPLTIRVPGGTDLTLGAGKGRIGEVEERARGLQDRVTGLSQELKDVRSEVRKLSGEAGGKTAAAKGVTTKSLRVVGIMESKGRRLAVVEDLAGAEHVLRPGDAIGDGKVVEVTKGGIVVESPKGERASLFLDRP